MARLRRTLDAGQQGFDAILDDRPAVSAAVREGRRLARLADTLVLDGIGGSALGPLALQTALRPRRRRLVVLDNVDPEGVSAKLQGLDAARTAVNVVTKSGSTAETMANLLILLDWMERRLGPRHVRRWTATTDPKKGELLVLARRLGIPALQIPPNVGGRFSVLTAVGLLPAAFLGLDVDGLLDGARAMRRHCWTASAQRNVGVLGAVLMHGMATRRGRNIMITMPYADGLVHLADWYRQLWAESLGKRVDRGGREVHAGPTPVAAVGATDQHSQVQLFMEGPFDKVITFAVLDDPGDDIRLAPIGEVPGAAPLPPDLSYLVGHTLGELLRAEYEATASALAQHGRMSCTLRLPDLSATTFGEAVMFYQIAAGYAGVWYGVDPFDQPGVELGKKLTYAAMGRPGYTAPAKAADEDRDVA